MVRYRLQSEVHQCTALSGYDYHLKAILSQKMNSKSRKTRPQPISHTSTHASNTSVCTSREHLQKKTPTQINSFTHQLQTEAAVPAQHRGLFWEQRSSSTGDCAWGFMKLIRPDLGKPFHWCLPNSFWDPPGVRELSLYLTDTASSHRGTATVILYWLQKSPSRTAWLMAATRHMGISLFLLTQYKTLCPVRLFVALGILIEIKKIIIHLPEKKTAF